MGIDASSMTIADLDEQAGGRIVKLSCLKLPLRMTILVIVLGPANKDVAAFSQRDLQAKIEYCKTCHGLYGQGFRGSVSMPRLAGQQAEYLENQLRAFVERRRESRFMFNVANALNPAMPEALAAHFADLNPKPLGGAPKELEAAGKKLYEEGVPEAEIRPCANCHGPDAKGKGASPRLAGQLYDYTLKTMVNWSKERGLDRIKPDKSVIMEPIVQNLTESQISALAAYLSGLE
jgi:cytochrome c553